MSYNKFKITPVKEVYSGRKPALAQIVKFKNPSIFPNTSLAKDLKNVRIIRHRKRLVLISFKPLFP